VKKKFEKKMGALRSGGSRRTKRPKEIQKPSSALLYDDVEVLPAEESPAKSSLPRSRATDLAPYDPLGAYLREISKFKPISREEEHELAVGYNQNQDIQAAYKLITSNLWLVVKIARDYERAARNLLDLVQEGNMGLMEAVKNFDPYRGVRFPSYAVWWIRAYIVRFVIANWRMVKVGTTQAQRKLFFNLKKEKEKLEREGFYPAPRLLAEKLNVKESEVVEMEQRLAAADLSVDAPSGTTSDSDLHAMLPSSELSAEDLLLKREMKDLLQESLQSFLETLNEKERVIFSRRMLSEEKETLQEISEKLDISRERVRQIENKIKDKLKSFIISKMEAKGHEPNFDFEQ